MNTRVFRVNWSARSEGNTTPSDIILWTNARGLYGGLAVSLSHISADAQMDSIYYQAAGDTDRDPHGQRQQPQCRQAP